MRCGSAGARRGSRQPQESMPDPQLPGAAVAPRPTFFSGSFAFFLNMAAPPQKGRGPGRKLDPRQPWHLRAVPLGAVNSAGLAGTTYRGRSHCNCATSSLWGACDLQRPRCPHHHPQRAAAGRPRRRRTARPCLRAQHHWCARVTLRERRLAPCGPAASGLGVFPTRARPPSPLARPASVSSSGTAPESVQFMTTSRTCSPS